MSTCAPWSGVQDPVPTCDRTKASVRGTPSFTTPVEVSERTSERLIFSSTKYGPSVSSGRTTQSGTAAVSAVGEAATGVAATAVAASAFSAVGVAAAGGGAEPAGVGVAAG